MVRIPVIKRDGRLEAERVVFDRPTSGSGTVGYPTVDAIFSAIFGRLPTPTSAQEADERSFYRDIRPSFLHLKACDDCGALYLDGRSAEYRAKRRCRGCYARHRYQYVQRARQAERDGRQAAISSCTHCGGPMAGRSDRKFCSGKCRVAALRTRRLLSTASV